MMRLIPVFFLLAPTLAMAQTPDPSVQLPTSLVQKLWQSAGKAPYEVVRPLEDELNRALRPPAQTSLPRGPQGGPGQPPVTPPSPQGGPGQPPVTPPPPPAEEPHDNAQ